jgi:hypothetical protein
LNDKLEDSDGDYDSDLDINFITKLEDFEITNDETDVRNQFQLDPSVWTNPIKPTTPSKHPQGYANHNNNHDGMGRKFQGPQPPPGILPPSLAQQTNALQQFIGGAPSAGGPKIMSLEEIERNLINQQQIQQHQKMMQEKLAAIQSKTVQQAPAPSPPVPQQNVQQVRKIIRNPNLPQPVPEMMFPPHINGPPPPGGFPVPPHLHHEHGESSDAHEQLSSELWWTRADETRPDTTAGNESLTSSSYELARESTHVPERAELGAVQPATRAGNSTEPSDVEPNVPATTSAAHAAIRQQQLPQPTPPALQLQWKA